MKRKTTKYLKDWLYRQDRMPPMTRGVRQKSERIHRIFSATILEVGKKVIYKRIDPYSQLKNIRRVIELIIDAKILLPYDHSNENSLPLIDESEPTIQKLYFLGIGLIDALMRFDLDIIGRNFEKNFKLKGLLSEQFAAHHLAYLYEGPNSPELYYWLRDKGSKKSEVDFLLQLKNKVILAAIMSTASGYLKSFFSFTKGKNKKSTSQLSDAIYAKSEFLHKVENYAK